MGVALEGSQEIRCGTLVSFRLSRIPSEPLMARHQWAVLVSSPTPLCDDVKNRWSLLQKWLQPLKD